MGTKYQLIRSYIRAALLDHDPANFQYSDQALNSQINFTVLQLSADSDNGTAYDISSTTPETFEGDLSVQQKLVLALETAIRILSGLPDSFAWRSPVLTVSRSGMKATLLQKLETALDEANGGQFAIAVDTDFNAIIKGFDRYFDAINSGIASV